MWFNSSGIFFWTFFLKNLISNFCVGNPIRYPYRVQSWEIYLNPYNPDTMIQISTVVTLEFFWFWISATYLFSNWWNAKLASDWLLFTALHGISNNDLIYLKTKQERLFLNGLTKNKIERYLKYKSYRSGYRY